jgi:hypothetical protein
MLRRLVSNGYFWLLVVSIPLFANHCMQPWGRLTLWADSYAYLGMADMDLTGADGLATMRTWGYPVLLKLYRLVWGPAAQADELWAALPTCHLLLYFAAVLVFYAGLRQLDFPAACGVLMCLPVIYFDYSDIIIYSVLSDAAGQAFLLLVIGSFFFVLRQPGRPWRWAALGFCVTASYHIRPALQFLLVLLPLLTLLAGRTSRKRERRLATVAHASGSCLCMLAVCWLPYLAYCGLRYHVVGQFSLVAYTGYNFFGLCGQLFTEEMLPEVRPECRPLAEALVRRRQERASQSTLRHWTGDMWFRQSHGWIPPLPHGRPVGELDYDRIQDQYSWVVWHVMWRWGREHYHNDRGIDVIALDRVLLTFSLDFIRHHPDIYVMCMLKGWRAALIFLFERRATRLPLLLFGCALVLAAGVRLAGGASRKRQRRPATVADASGSFSFRQRLTIFTQTAVLLFVLKIQLAVMVVAIMMYGDIDGRYVDTAALLLPCLPMLGVYYLGQDVVTRVARPGLGR